MTGSSEPLAREDNHIASIPEDPAIHVDEGGESDFDDEIRGRWPCVLHKLIDEARDDEWRQVVERVRNHPEEVIAKSSPGGLNALHEACVRYPPLQVIEELLKVAPQEAIQLKNRDGETPLHTASYSSSEEVQEALFRALPESLTIQDRNYLDTPLHLAARAGATYRLMETFVRFNPKSLSIRNRRGATPFWCLRRTYLEAGSMEEIMDEEGTDYRLDWDLMVLFLRVDYESTWDTTATKVTASANRGEIEALPSNLPEETDDTHARNPQQIQYLLHAATATPPCPRDVLRFLCRHFGEQALQYDRQGMTPLVIASKADVMLEPSFDESAEGFDDEPTNDDDDGSVLLNLEDLALQSEAGETGEEGEPESVLNIILDCNPKAASYGDGEGRLPLAHAISTGKCWNAGVKQLIDACPRALECRDMSTRLHMFQLAAIHSPELDTVYSMVRSLPELLAFRDGHAAQEVQEAEGVSDDVDAQTDGFRKKRRG